ncbi:N-acetylmuramate alpha-1-phosphate uridylyltransferase MurU [Methylophilus luteus]|uniref:N-acetylmuramate alpha-1-phosphate uridylyltransferase MurU n=1 Tax=Methylophilus luteus TaxID=640108 RepID=A0ABW3F381_9PROT
MRAMILAAGRGERMRPLTDHTPKPLLPVGGKPLIVWHIERLAQAGIREIVINHAHLGQQIEQALGDGRQWQVDIQYSPEQTALETAGGIAQALPLLGEQPFLVVNGDVFTDIDYATLALPATSALPEAKLAHLVMVDNPPQHAQGDFALEYGLVKETGEHKLTFSGVGVYHPQLFQHVVRGQPAKLAPLLKTAMQQALVSGQHHTGIWHDIGTPERLQQIDAWLNTTKNQGDA